MESVLRFWLDRGVDGFRIDVAHALVKADGLPDATVELHRGRAHRRHADVRPAGRARDLPAVAPDHRLLRVEGEDADRILCAEASVLPIDQLAKYVRGDELDQSFNFGFLMAPWIAKDLQAEIADSLAAVAPYDAPQTWVLSNHDVVRHASRLRLRAAAGLLRMPGDRCGRPAADAEVGLRRAARRDHRDAGAAGSAYLTRARSSGSRRRPQLPHELRQDPTWARSGHTNPGRDGCRVPIPWEGAAPSYGFGPSEKSGCRNRRRTASSRSTSRSAWRARPSSSTGPFSAATRAPHGSR